VHNKGDQRVPVSELDTVLVVWPKTEECRLHLRESQQEIQEQFGAGKHLYLFESSTVALAVQLVPRWDGRVGNSCSIIPEGNHTWKLGVVQLQVCCCLYITKLGLEDELRTTVLTSTVEVKCVGKDRPCVGR